MESGGINTKRYEGKFHESFFDEVYLITYRLMERILEYYNMKGDLEITSIMDSYLNLTMECVNDIRSVDYLVLVIEFVESCFCRIEDEDDPFFRVRDYERFKRLDEIFSTKEVESKDN